VARRTATRTVSGATRACDQEGNSRMPGRSMRTAGGATSMADGSPRASKEEDRLRKHELCAPSPW